MDEERGKNPVYSEGATRYLERSGEEIHMKTRDLHLGLGEN